jgi:hypothetical protein
MKVKLYCLVLFVFLFSIGRAQKYNRKELFINEIYKYFVDTNFTKYYLSFNCSKLHLDKGSIEQQVLDFDGMIPKDNLQQIINNSSTDPILQKWDCHFLIKAQCVDSDTACKITRCSLVYTVQSNWSKRRKQKEIQKQIEKRVDQIARIPLEDKSIYYFGRPIFDNTGDFAIIDMAYGCGNLCGHGCTFLFKRIDSKWKLVAKSNCRTS